MQRLKDKVGEARFEAVLLSIDEDYGSRSEGESEMRSALAENGIKLPCAIVPGGSSETQKKFGISGYDNFIVGPDGTIKATDVNESDFESFIGS